MITIDHGQIKDLPTLTALAWKALLQANDPPRYFRHGDGMIRIAQTEGETNCQRLTHSAMRYELSRTARWLKNGKESNPPKDIISDMFACPAWPLPALDRIVEVPVFGSSGKLLTEPGYRPDERLYYAPARHLECLPVPDAPSESEITRSVALIEQLLRAFPIVSQSERFRAYRLLFAPFLGSLIDDFSFRDFVKANLKDSRWKQVAAVFLYIGLGKADVKIATGMRRLDPEIGERIQREREELIQAAHILIRNWVAKGKARASTRRLFDCELISELRLATVVGRILEAVGLSSFSAEDLTEYTNPWHSFCRSWYGQFGTRKVLVADLMALASQSGLPMRGDTVQQYRASLGKRLGQQARAGAVYADCRILQVDGKSNGHQFWRLESVKSVENDTELVASFEK